VIAKTLPIVKLCVYLLRQPPVGPEFTLFYPQRWTTEKK